MHDFHGLTKIIILLAAAVFIVACFRRLRLSPVLGFFVAGAAIGPSGFHIIETKDTEIFAHFGVVFLLFAIGLELTFERLKAMRKHVFGFGTLQVIITGFLIGIAAFYFIGDLNAAVIIGGGLALSSTAVVLQDLVESGKQSGQVGRLSLAILLLQDFAVVPLLVLVPLLAQNSTDVGGILWDALVKAMIALVVIFIVGRLLFRPLFRIISAARSEDLFVALTLLIVLGTAFLTEKLGLSLALGAFVAGILVAETEFHNQVADSIMPFKGLLLGLFFMTVGMSLDMTTISNNLVTIGLLSVGLLIVKGGIIISLCRLFQFSMGASTHAGLLLAQGGEFAFILFGLASQQGVVMSEHSQILLMVVTLTMALTPLLSVIGQRLSNWLDTPDQMDVKQAHKEIGDLDHHVIIAGFGRVGQMVCRLLAAEGINYIAVDLDSARVTEGRTRGFPVYHGDATRRETLDYIGLDRADTVIITIENDITMKKTLEVTRAQDISIPIIIRTADLRDAKLLYKIGATKVVPSTYETGLQLGSAVLESIGISEHEITRLKVQFRTGNYVKAVREDEKESEA